ncbi:hypothetical protein D0Z07_4860 [Hyphodiscus hymeniophilus]|uniref:Rho-GAP domain-containing protein n=1 Tax=Hyphodiscus hymeniophilus TaxID=353542 RepID=A0A9P6VJA7_9HELO|nr:hypothetical protein D0Z07_4860 [Hyphodiscus hymeniophilus]
MAHKIDIIPDDMNITLGLLGRPHIPPRRKTSFTSTTKSVNTEDIADYMEEGMSIKDDGRRRRAIQSSNTWTTSSGEILSDKDDMEDRSFFILEYNRLAQKHAVRLLIPEDSNSVDSDTARMKSGSWFSRKILRRTSSGQSAKHKNDRSVKHRRSISDLSIRLKSKNNTLKDKDLQELVRLCGLSLLYLPTEYAASSLAVPTCFRATAQYLVQHVSGTVRCPTLPEHIRCDVHDVASAFKKLISGLPGGILGSLPLFGAFISIQSQFHSSPELTRTKQSKVRARLIALAISTLRSQYRRELICAVFGLLSMIGRAAETMPRENERGQPLPTSDLMGYGPLGIVFGPLLVGDLLEDYPMRLPDPRGGLVLLPISPPKSRKERNKKSKTSEDCSAFNASFDKIKIANTITEMLITHWRDVVRHMKSMKSLKIVRSYKSLEAASSKQPILRPSASESFCLRKPPDWDKDNNPLRETERCESPTPASRGDASLEAKISDRLSPRSNDTLNVRKQRSRLRPLSSQKLSGARSMSILSPTKEENVAEFSPKPNLPSPKEPLSVAPPEQSDESQTFLDMPEVSSPKVGKVPKTTSEISLVDDISQPHRSVSPDSVVFSTNKVSSKSENVLSMTITGSSSSPVTEHDPQKCSPLIELKICAPTIKSHQEESSLQDSELKDYFTEDTLKDSAPTAKPEDIIQQTLLPGLRQPTPLTPYQSNPDIRISRVTSLGHPELPGSRRISASEPGLQSGIRLGMPTTRPIRHSKSSVAETGTRNIAEKWRVSRDPLANVSVADDLASLVTLAHVLEEEPSETKVEYNASGEATGERFDDIARQTIEKRLPKLVQRLEQTPRTSREQSDFAKPAREVIAEYAAGTLAKPKYDTFIRRMGDLADKELSSSANDSRPVQNSLERPSVIQGPNFNHLSRGPPSPKKKNIRQKFGISGSPTVAKQPNPMALSTERFSVEIQAKNNQTLMSQSPRLSVRALAAKFNLEDSGSIVGPSPTKSFSKAIPLDIRAGLNTPEKIIAPYTTNSSSPTKSQKSSISSISIRSARILPTTGGTMSDISPPRKLLRSDLNDSTPLRPVPIPKAVLLAPESPACCSPIGSPARMSMYDGSSVQVSESSTPCPMSPSLHSEQKEASLAIANAITISSATETQIIPMAINPVTSATPTRSNSLLRTQIRNLQQQLDTKIEEVRHLKRQLDTRGNLDMGTLSEELRKAKNEVQFWKHRAEVAEKQLQVMAALSSRKSSNHAVTNSSSTLAGHTKSTPSRTNYSENEPTGAQKVRKGLHGMDGASSLFNSSESSTETVVHEVRMERMDSEIDYSV